MNRTGALIFAAQGLALLSEPTSLAGSELPFPLFRSQFELDLWDADLQSYHPEITFLKLDGDALPDLVSFQSPEGLAVRYCVGNFEYGPPTILATESEASVHRMADVDGDGRLDLIYCLDVPDGEDDPHLRVRFQSEAGVFGPEVNTGDPSALLRGCLVAEDLNGDGFADLVAAGRKTLSVRLGAGDGTFPTLMDYEMPELIEDVRHGDIDGATGIDLLVNMGSVGKIRPLLNNGAGVFSAGTDINHATSSWTIRLFNCNDDAAPDLLVGLKSPPSLRIMTNDGDGTFNLLQEVTLEHGIQDPLFFDGRGDGRDEIVYRDGGLLRALEWDGFSGYREYFRNDTAIESSRPSGLMDLNGDAMIDLYVSNASNAMIAVYMGIPDGTFLAEGVTFPEDCVEACHSREMGMGDFDGDGRMDLVNGVYDLYYYISRGESGISFETSKTDFGEFTGLDASVVGWFNQDEFPDIVTAELQRLVFLAGRGDGTFEEPTTAWEDRAEQLEVADLNGDGFDDLVGIVDSGLAVWLANGDGTFEVAASLSTESAPDKPRLGDFNGDGLLDIAVGLTGQDQVGVFLQTGEAAFATMISLEGGTTIPRLTTGDFNADGCDDLLVPFGSVDTAIYHLYLGAKSGTFTASITNELKEFIYHSQAADIDLDGHLDLVTTSGYPATVGVYLGDGLGAFARRFHYAGAEFLHGIKLGDFDRDGDRDVAVAGWTHIHAINHITILENLLLGPDTIAPVSQITTPPAVLAQTSPVIPLEWTGSDNQTGIWRVELYYAKDGGTFVSYGKFGESPISFNASNTGGEGVYQFYVRAIDGARNVEEAPVGADTTVTLNLSTNVNGWQLME